MKQFVSLFLLILLLSACAPAQTQASVATVTVPVISTEVPPPVTFTPPPLTATPPPPTATTDPTGAYITMMWSTKSVLLTAYPAPTFPTETPTPTMLPGSPVCHPMDLRATLLGSSGAAGHILITIRVDNTSSTDCFLPAFPVVQLLDPIRKPLNLNYSYCDPECPIVPLQPTDEVHPGQPARYGLKRWQSATFDLWWSNGCDKSGLPKGFIIDIEMLDGAGKIELTSHESLSGAACYDPTAPSTINIAPFEAVVNP